RGVWRLLRDDRSRDAVETAERYADRLATPTDLAEAFAAAHAAFSELPLDRPRRRGKRFEPSPGYRTSRIAAHLARLAADPTLSVWSVQRHLLRARSRTTWFLASVLRDLLGPLPFRPIPLDPTWSSGNDHAVANLARTLYAEQTFHEWPVLADALEDAGCADP